MEQVEEVEVDLETGLVGDHFKSKDGHRKVTLIQKEHIDAVAKFLNKEVHHGQLRRNIVVEGINLIALHDQEFELGDEVVLKGTGPCVPCSRMEENLGPGGYNAMRGHGGITATVVKPGRIRVGDKVRIRESQST